MKITAPTNCPSCNSILEWKNDTLYCVSDDCYAKIDKKIEHWAKTLKIKGLGPQTISKLNLESISDLYTLSISDIKTAIKSEKIANALIEELEKSKYLTVKDYIAAFGIPLVGRTIAEKLSKELSNFDEITISTLKAAGIGQKASENIINWYNKQFIPNIKLEMPFLSTIRKEALKTTENKGIVCITGKLVSFKTKAEAYKALIEHGYQVKESLTKDVTHLINESAVSTAKTEKAEKLGVVVITNIKDLLGD